MTWQKAQLVSQSFAHADPGGQVPKAEVPSIQSGRLRPLQTQVPLPRQSPWQPRAGPDGLPVNPVPTRCFRHRPGASRPRGPPAQRAGAGLPRRLFTASASLVGP